MELRERNKEYYPHGLHPHLARIGQTHACAKARVTTGTALVKRYALHYALPKK